MCETLGHEEIIVIEERTRIRGNGYSKVGRYTFRDSSKGGHVGEIRSVFGSYTKCARCDKKLSSWKRF